MVEPLGLCADLEFALTCVRQDLCTWSTCTHTCTHKHEAVMCLIYRPEHLGNRFENAAKRMCSLGSCTVTLPAVHNRKQELPCGYLLFSIFVPPFVSYSSWSLWIHSSLSEEIHLVRFLVFLLPFTFCLCDCNGHLVLNLPLTHVHPRRLSVFVSLFFSSAVSLTRLAVYFSVATSHWGFLAAPPQPGV